MYTIVICSITCFKNQVAITQVMVLFSTLKQVVENDNEVACTYLTILFHKVRFFI